LADGTHLSATDGFVKGYCQVLHTATIAAKFIDWQKGVKQAILLCDD
jgi:hypothetical protein